ncbi:excalibur calcium-binding domain-containing protein [Sphingomonas segetis]|jgi:hypothetical protein|uniref:excalibur calcium-binding domain-containing protein n=1 Tax=Sphingomonas segetis TaxID=1104779 RepID=UPI0018AD3ED3|nr:excalibur calcium-binding domain-containing protein [Sphingomonas segetis]
MRAVLIVAAAVMLGLAGGYAWSALLHEGAKPPVPKAAAVAAVSPLDIPASASDEEWAARAAAEETPAIAPPGVDPAALEQSAHYSGCDEVRAAGKAPLHSGEPGYRSDMDGDGDGVACEPDRRF